MCACGGMAWEGTANPWTQKCNCSVGMTSACGIKKYLPPRPDTTSPFIPWEEKDRIKTVKRGTFEGCVIRYLEKLGFFGESFGLSEEQIDAIMVKVKEEQLGMEGRWDMSSHGHPISVIIGLKMTAKHCGLKYIKAECPDTFCRPMFES